MERLFPALTYSLFLNARFPVAIADLWGQFVTRSSGKCKKFFRGDVLAFSPRQQAAQSALLIKPSRKQLPGATSRTGKRLGKLERSARRQGAGSTAPHTIYEATPPPIRFMEQRGGQAQSKGADKLPTPDTIYGPKIPHTIYGPKILRHLSHPDSLSAFV